MDYRDERDALRGRVERLEQELDDARRELAEARRHEGKAAAKGSRAEVEHVERLDLTLPEAEALIQRLRRELGRARSEMKGSQQAPTEPDPDRDGPHPVDTATITRKVTAESRVKARLADRSIGVLWTVVGVVALVAFSGDYTYVSGGSRHHVAPPEGVHRILALLLALIAWALALWAMFRGYLRGKHEAWLRVNGILLPARIVNVERRKDLRFSFESDYRLLFEVAGPKGPYGVVCEVDVPLQHLAALRGAAVNVRANPRNLKDILVEE